jgi:hypothetical protein
MVSMIEVDDRHWPVTIFRFTGRTTLDELDAYLGLMEGLLARGERDGYSAGIVIQKKMRMWESALVRRQAQWMKANAERLRKNSLGVALVLDNPLMRGLLRAILWVQPMPQPHTVVGTVGEALSWVEKRLAAVNLKAPPGAREALEKDV